MELVIFAANCGITFSVSMVLFIKLGDHRRLIQKLQGEIDELKSSNPDVVDSESTVR